MPVIGTHGAASAKGFGFTNQSTGGIRYVGASINAYDGAASPLTFNLTNLTGGIATSPSNGDFIVLFVGVALGPNSNTTISVNTSGYTQYTTAGRTNSSTSVRMSVFGKFANGDTSVQVSSGASGQESFAVYALVFRGVNASPMDATPTTITTTNTMTVPGINVSTAGTYIAQAATYAHIRGLCQAETVGALNPRSAGFNDVYDVTMAGGYAIPAQGQRNAINYSFGCSASTAFSGAGITLALRPA